MQICYKLPEIIIIPQASHPCYEYVGSLTLGFFKFSKLNFS